MSNANVDAARLWCERNLSRNGSLQRDGRTWLCSSPMREDKHPSLSVDIVDRCYKDHGTNEKGTISELAGLMGAEPPQWEPEAGREKGKSPSRTRDASSDAVKLWRSAKPAQADHAYLQRKHVAPHSCREVLIGGERVLLVPAFDESGHIVGCERIWSDGRKQHLGTKAGAFHLLGVVEAGKPIALTEGYATGASVHEFTRFPVVVCFGQGNVPTIAQKLREAHPDMELVAATDNDDAGRESAAACPAGTLAVIPSGAIPHCDWCDVAVELGQKEAARQFAQRLDAARAEAPELPKKKDALGLLFYDELTYTEPEYLVSSLIEKHTVGLLFGATATKKSFIALDIAACVATGAAFHGRVVEQGPVVYLAGEGSKGIGRRLKAWEKHFGVSLKGAPLLVSMRAPRFGDPRSAKEAVDDIRAKLRERGITGAALVVVDTLARAAVGLDENSNQDMAEFVAVLDSLKDELGCVVLAIHHSGYMETGRARGASCVPAAMDFIFAAKADCSFVTLTATKVKDAEEPAPITFECVSETIGAGRYGEPLTSLVLEEVDASPREKTKPLTKAQQLGLDSFREAARKAGTLDVSLEAWREAFYRVHTGDSPDSKRMAFNRARQSLVYLGKLSVKNDTYSESGDIADFLRHESEKGKTERTEQTRTFDEHVRSEHTVKPNEPNTLSLESVRCSVCVRAENDTGEEKEECPAVVLPDKEPEKKEPILLSGESPKLPADHPFAVLGLLS